MSAKIGFTGTHSRLMTPRQRAALARMFQRKRPSEFHHGVCVGADEDANAMATVLKIRTVGHPPIDEKFMAECACDEMLEPDEYMARNHAIVDATDFLVAAPMSRDRVLRSGTWATVRYAEKVGKRVVILKP